MTIFCVTKEALSSFYAGPYSLLISEDIFERLKSLCPQNIKPFCLHSDGKISAQSDHKADDAKTFSLSGMPAGLMGVVVSSNCGKQGAAFLEFASYHGGNKPAYMELKRSILTMALPGKAGIHARFISFLNSLITDHMQNIAVRLSEREQQVVHLRKKNEDLRLNVEKARRMISGIGFSTRSVSFELLPSVQESVSLSAEKMTYAQTLPTDMLGFCGLSLYLHTIPAAAGVLKVSVSRRADHRLLGEVSVPYAALHEGWNDFSMEDIKTYAFGDGVLTISCEGKDAPAIALAKDAVDRFGVEHSSVALRIYKGLYDIGATEDEASSPYQETVQKTETVRDIPAEQWLERENRKLQVRAYRFSELNGQVEFYSGRSVLQQLTSKYGFSPLMVSEGTGAMQTHPLMPELSAVFMPGGAVVGAHRIMAEIGTGHESAPDFTYVLMVLPQGTENRQEVIEEIAAKVQAGVLQSYDENTGVFWNSATIKAMLRSTLSIGFDHARDEPGDVVFAVLPVDGNMSFGWCNWYLFANITQGYDHPVKLLSAPSDR